MILRIGAALALGAIAITAFGRTPAQADDSVPSSKLCKPGETVLFGCRIRAKLVAVCARGSAATYRFGRPGHVELELGGGRHAFISYGSGGQTQISFAAPDARYIVYARMIRIGFDDEGHNLSRFDSGLLISRPGRRLMRRDCTDPPEAVIINQSERLPEGEALDW